MLMSPHHLQQLDLYHEDLLEQRLRAVTPHDWGVVTCDVDLRALGAGQVRVQNFIGVLPDGLYVCFDHDDPETPPARPIEGHFPPKQPALEVFLGVPREREGAPNLAADGKPNPRARFVGTQRPIWDTTTGGVETPLSFAQRHVMILFGDEPREDYEAVKVAEIVRDKTGAFAVCEPYVPPCLRIGASPFLIDAIKRLLAVSTTKQRTLSEQRRHREGSQVEFTPGDVTRYLLINAVNTFIPVLSHLADGKDLPPRTAYLLLAQYLGSLCSFSADADPTTVPNFVYTDLRATFEPMFAKITALLHQTVRENFLGVALEARQDGLHLGRLDDDRLVRATQFILAVKSRLPEQQTAEQLPKLAKLASWQEIGSVVQAATPGVPLTVNHRPPPEIPVRPGMVYFSLGTGDRHWRTVVAERTVAIYLPPPFTPTDTQLQLMAVPPASAPDARG
jgi:type VI secretion system protein ImpJ